jgi:hypothetical protein
VCRDETGADCDCGTDTDTDTDTDGGTECPKMGCEGCYICEPYECCVDSMLVNPRDLGAVGDVDNYICMPCEHESCNCDTDTDTDTGTDTGTEDGTGTDTGCCCIENGGVRECSSGVLEADCSCPQAHFLDLDDGSVRVMEGGTVTQEGTSQECSAVWSAGECDTDTDTGTENPSLPFLNVADDRSLVVP